MSDPAQTVTPTLGPQSPVIHLTEQEANDATEVYRIACRSEDPYALTRAIEFILRGRVMKARGVIEGPMAFTVDGISEPLLPSPSEREELASVISHAINFDDGAHHLSMGDDGEPCRACQDVADAVLAAGYSKRSSPSSGGVTR